MKKFTVDKIIEETKEHLYDIKAIMIKIINDLTNRAIDHDLNKLDPKNAEILCKALNKETSFDEWNEIHMKILDHHLEYYVDITMIPLPALIEMVADGASACYRRNGIEQCTYEAQYDFFIHKGFDLQLSSILAKEFIRYVNILVEKDEQDE